MTTNSIEEIPSVGIDPPGPGASSAEPNAKPCASSCSSMKYKVAAFLIPCLAVTAYSLTQETSCATGGTHPCAISAVVLGLLAGATSFGLVSAIKAFKARTIAKA